MSTGSIIGAGTVVRGSVGGEGALEISGRVEGDVSVEGDVVVAESGAVRGNITGVRISVLGAVQGDLRGTEAVLIERGGRVVGDLSAPRIGIANGALVRGTARTEGEPALATGRRPAPAASRATPAGSLATAFAAKPVAKVEAKPVPKPALAIAAAAPEQDSEPLAGVAALRPRETRDKVPERRPPPPVVPSLGKGAKAKKKKSRES